MIFREPVPRKRISTGPRYYFLHVSWSDPK